MQNLISEQLNKLPEFPKQVELKLPSLDNLTLPTLQ